MIYKHEKLLHDCCMALFTAGMIGTLCHVGFSQLFELPVQHTGTQTYRMVAR